MRLSPLSHLGNEKIMSSKSMRNRLTGTEALEAIRRKGTIKKIQAQTCLENCPLQEVDFGTDDRLAL